MLKVIFDIIALEADSTFSDGPPHVTKVAALVCALFAIVPLARISIEVSQCVALDDARIATYNKCMQTLSSPNSDSTRAQICLQTVELDMSSSLLGTCNYAMGSTSSQFLLSLQYMFIVYTCISNLWVFHQASRLDKAYMAEIRKHIKSKEKSD